MKGKESSRDGKLGVHPGTMARSAPRRVGNVACAGLALLAPLLGLGAPLRTIPLDEARAVTITIATDAPTTCRFPGPIAGLEVANVSAKPEDRPPVLLSHQTGTAFFSVRALNAEAKAAANVIYGGKIYVLNFSAGPDPDRSVVFTEEKRMDPNLISRARPEALIARAKVWNLLLEQQPKLASGVTHAESKSLTEYRDFSATVEEVWRFNAEDSLVLRVRIENRSASLLRLSPVIAIRVGKVIAEASAFDGPHEIPALGSADLWLACTGEGQTAGISADNVFRVLVSRA